jgi:hypothetical protein
MQGHKVADVHSWKPLVRTLLKRTCPIYTTLCDAGDAIGTPRAVVCGPEHLPAIVAGQLEPEQFTSI